MRKWLSYLLIPAALLLSYLWPEKRPLKGYTWKTRPQGE